MHKKINSHAIYLLPPELITLYKNNEFTLKVYATKPDNRRYIDPKEGPRHFIDLDTYVALDSGFIGLNYWQLTICIVSVWMKVTNLDKMASCLGIAFL